ncbi:MAG: sugar ABC transporter permease [Streptosporangiales bacterium]|nr:sugar ABC transporter permease [Streptosporangiales bacterium]
MSQTQASGDGAATVEVDTGLLVRERGLRGYGHAAARRLRTGEIGFLPVILGLAVIAAVFQSLNPAFLGPQNLSNIAVQMVPIGIIAVGVVLVLLLGQIDLSVGSVSGVCAAILAVLNVKQGMPAVVAIALSVAAGTLIGLVQGSIFAVIGVPTFVVTLAGLIGWMGLQLYVLGETGTINVPYDGGVAKLANTFFAQPWVGYTLGAAVVAVYLATALRADRRRAVAGLPSRTLVDTLVRAGLLAAVVFGVVAVLNQARGIPLALLIFVGLVVVLDLVLRRTRYGRSIFAVGGNVEAARRAGFNVTAIRMSVFAIASSLAAFGGVMAASRLFAVNQSSGASDVLLMAIAAAVIGGTSLFGGRGSTYSALLGILVIQSITSGMLLLQVSSEVRFMITAKEGTRGTSLCVTSQ